jgi:ubiquinone biosynthesis monooxygenase Coq7
LLLFVAADHTMIAVMEPSISPLSGPAAGPVSALPPETRFGGQVMKVDHAGEHGAICLYRAQIALARRRAPQLVPQLEHFLAQELGHHARFAEELRRRGLRRCHSYSLCGLGGWMLGALTGLAGAQAIAATVVAVERVVLAQLKRQMKQLAQDPNAYGAVLNIVLDEREQRERAKLALCQGSFWPRLILPVVGAAVRANHLINGIVLDSVNKA